MDNFSAATKTCTTINQVAWHESIFIKKVSDYLLPLSSKNVQQWLSSSYCNIQGYAKIVDNNIFFFCNLLHC
jgi:hypothetical protein